MSATLGALALWCAAAAAVAQGYLGLRPHTSQASDTSLLRLASLQLGFLVLTFATLTIGFIRSDFSLALVAAHSHAAKPLLYRIAGVWGNHEGSMLLWCLVMAVYACAFAQTERAHKLWRTTLGYMGVLQAGFLFYVLLASNPMRRLAAPPFEGAGLNPILQDPALAAHPPFLYLGFVGFALAFAIALAFLHERRAEKDARAFAETLHLWVLPAWSCLTLGIALGAFWAYYELGWGGFWFWDPVENASLMPWLAGTALLHSNLVLRARGAMLNWVLLLAIGAFGMSLFGTFLVRSGAVSSVHAFASDPTRGIFLLALLGAFGGFALAQYARRAKDAAAAPQVLWGRVGALLLNNVFLLTALLTVLLGTLYPMAMEVLRGTRLSVGAPYFATVFRPLSYAAALLLPLGVWLAWDAKTDARALWRRMRLLALAALAVGLVLSVGAFAPWRFALAASLAVWLLGGAVLDFWAHRSAGLRAAGRALAHGSLGLLLLGIVGATALAREAVWAMQPGDARELAGARLTFDSLRIYDGANFQSEQGIFTLSRRANTTTLKPERRFYDAEQGSTSEAAFNHRRFGNFYLQLGEAQDNNSRIVRAWYHPLVLLIWLGSGLIASGGVLVWLALWRVRLQKSRA